MRDISVNQRLKALLREKHIKQTKLAASTGIAYQNLHRAVNGRRPIYADEIVPLATAIGVTADTLLGLEQRAVLQG